VLVLEPVPELVQVLVLAPVWVPEPVLVLVLHKQPS